MSTHIYIYITDICDRNYRITKQNKATDTRARFTKARDCGVVVRTVYEMRTNRNAHPAAIVIAKYDTLNDWIVSIGVSERTNKREQERPDNDGDGGGGDIPQRQRKRNVKLFEPNWDGRVSNRCTHSTVVEFIIIFVIQVLDFEWQNQSQNKKIKKLCDHFVVIVEFFQR